MSLLSKIFSRENPNIVMRPLYDAIIAAGRQPKWYEKGQVPDNIDGRFDMIAAIFCLILIRLERESDTAQKSAWLTEIFITDMDGQLRQIGIGEMVVGKHVGRMMGALGGRLGAYRDALMGDQNFSEALTRNLYRGKTPQPEALEFVSTSLDKAYANLNAASSESILVGEIEMIMS